MYIIVVVFVHCHRKIHRISAAHGALTRDGQAWWVNNSLILFRFVVFMCRFDSSCRFTVLAYYVYNLLTSTGMLDRIIPTTAIMRMYTVRILLPIKRNNWWDIYAHDAATVDRESPRFGHIYNICTRIYIIFFSSNYTLPEDTRFSFNFSRTRARRFSRFLFEYTPLLTAFDLWII